MITFTDTAIILSLRAHMDKGFVVSAFTGKHGRMAGYAYKSGIQGLEIGSIVELQYEGKDGQLGGFKHFDIEHNLAPLIIHDRVKLSLAQSFCGVLDVALPEREPHEGLFAASVAFLSQITQIDDPLVLGALYVRWELMVLQALGYGLDLSKCNATETTENLIYVSPKTGKAVCAEAGEPFKDRLLMLPAFLRPDASFDLTVEDVPAGLILTQTFFEKWVLAHMSANLPAIRYTVAKALAQAARH